MVRNGRGRTETVDKHLQTVTTNCGRFYGKAMGYKKDQIASEVDRICSNKFVPLPSLKRNKQAMKRCMSGQELVASHVFPTTRRHSKMSGAPVLQIGACSESKTQHMAGNSMNVPSVGAVMLAGILGLSWMLTKVLYLIHFDGAGQCNIGMAYKCNIWWHRVLARTRDRGKMPLLGDSRNLSVWNTLLGITTSQSRWCKHMWYHDAQKNSNPFCYLVFG